MYTPYAYLGQEMFYEMKYQHLPKLTTHTHFGFVSKK